MRLARNTFVYSFSVILISSEWFSRAEFKRKNRKKVNMMCKGHIGYLLMIKVRAASYPFTHFPVYSVVVAVFGGEFYAWLKYNLNCMMRTYKRIWFTHFIRILEIIWNWIKHAPSPISWVFANDLFSLRFSSSSSSQNKSGHQ